MLYENVANYDFQMIHNHGKQSCMCKCRAEKFSLTKGKFSDQFSEIKIYGTPANLPTITIEVVTLGSKP